APGEIVGLGGLVGAGRTELLETLFGIRRARAGIIRLQGDRIDGRGQQERIRRGMAFVPEDRQQHGVFLASSVRHNLSLSGLRQVSVGGWVQDVRERQLSATLVRQLGIRCRNDGQIARFLSGGNQQKLVLGRWLARDPKVLLLDEPTRGVDVGAKQELYQLLGQLAERGMAILFASSDMEELLRLADRIYVLRDGRIHGELRHDDATELAVLRLATGFDPTDVKGAPA
ncbi:MAG TPA: ATP-binding cassette domain-containing protein, partial [Pirellulaceae bacterium]